MIYHIVWIPKFRKRLLDNKIKERLRELFYECALVNNWEIIEMAIEVDHIHAMLQLPPKISISKVVQLFKGGSSKIIRKEFPNLVEFLWGDNFWAEGYFVETIGQKNEQAIREYILNQ